MLISLAALLADVQPNRREPSYAYEPRPAGFRLPDGSQVLSLTSGDPETSSLESRTDVFRAGCRREGGGSLPVEVEVRKTIRGSPGSITLRVGERSVPIPPDILNGALVGGSDYIGRLGCSDTIVRFHPSIEGHGPGRWSWEQNIDFDLASGILRVEAIRQVGAVPRESRSN